MCGRSMWGHGLVVNVAVLEEWLELITEGFSNINDSMKSSVGVLCPSGTGMLGHPQATSARYNQTQNPMWTFSFDIGL